jgi:hypothetical protein
VTARGRPLARVLALSLAAGCVLAAGAAPAAAQDAPAGPAAAATAGPAATSAAAVGNPPPESRDGPLAPLVDPKGWAADVFTEVLTGLLRGVADAFRGTIDRVLRSDLNFVTQTPAAGSYASPTVRALWEVVRGAANAALVLVALAAAYQLMVGEQIGAPYHGATELLPRLALGALLVNTSLGWGRVAIDANNALCGLVGQAALPAWERADTATRLFVDVLALVVYLAAGLLLLLQMLMRLALLDVLLVASPLALLCWVLPQTQGWARLWAGTFCGAVFAQFLQVLALKLGGSLLTELGLMSADAAFLALLLGVAVLALTLRIPGLVARHAGDGLSFVRYVVYQQAARALVGPGRRAGGGGGAAPGRATRGAGTGGRGGAP